MSTLLVGYDLNKPGQQYAPLIEKLKGLGGWWHCLDSTWLISTTLTPVQLRDQLKPLIDVSDELLVIDVSGDQAAWRGFETKCSDWLVQNLG
jgi:hypothetical protein